MSLYIRGDIWWSRIKVCGKVYQFSTKQTSKRAAQKWEEEKIASLQGETAPQRAYEKIKELMVEKNLSFPDAFKFFEQYPRAKMPGPKMAIMYQTCWNDFAAFAVDQGIQSISMVTEKIAVQYINQLRTKGKYAAFEYKRGNGSISAPPRERKLSSTTINKYLAVLKLIFNVLLRGKYCLENPFEYVNRLPKDQVDREIFTPEELHRLGQFQTHEMYPILIVGCFTGLRLVDICHIKWEYYDSERRWLSGIQHKTKQPYEMPVLDSLYRFLNRLEPNRSIGSYIFPELAALYEKKPGTISKKFKELLQEAGIENATKDIPGRSKLVSVKDIHSLRHTFAYIAGMSNIPLAVVQGVLGHMTPTMTKHYMAHATEEDKRKHLQALPDFLTGSRKRDLTRERVAHLVERITPDNVERFKRRILALLQ